MSVKQVTGAFTLLALGTLGVGAWQAREVFELLKEVKDPEILRTIVGRSGPLPAGLDPNNPKKVKMDFVAPGGPLLQGKLFHGEVNEGWWLVVLWPRSQIHATR